MCMLYITLHALPITTLILPSRKLMPYPCSHFSHLSNQYERCESQYTFVNPFETDCDRFIDTRFIIKYMTYESPLKK